MDGFSPDDGYRRVRRCPECGTALEERSTKSAVVDRCPDCAGVWIDWFDGEVSAVAADVAPTPPAAHAGHDGARVCPDCRAPLSVAHYPDEVSEAEILRCGSCAGAFVPSAALDLVVALGPPDSSDSRRSHSRLVEVWEELRRLFSA